MLPIDMNEVAAIASPLSVQL